MGKLTWLGWQKSAAGAARPSGPIIKRDGTRVLCLTLPPAPAPQAKKPARRKPAPAAKR